MEEQTVKITLDQWDEYQSLLRHKKEVKIIEEFDYTDKSKGFSISWKSDGKCWLLLTDKLYNASVRVKELIKEIEQLKKMNLIEFIKWRKK